MSRRFRLTARAEADIDELASFIAADDIDAALAVLAQLEVAFETLATHPEIGHSRSDITARPLKFWRVYSYLVVYIPASSPLTIVAVLHGARDVARILDEEGRS